MSEQIRRRLGWAGTTMFVAVAVVVTSAAMTLPVFASSGERGFRIRHFEVLQVLEGRGEALPTEHAATLVLNFHAYHREFTLHLQPNRRLAAVADQGQGLYAGTLAGVPDSWARISVMSGITRGMFWDGRDLYLVDSAQLLGFAAAGDTVIYRLADAVSGAPQAQTQALRSLLDETKRSRSHAAEFRLDVSVLSDAAFRARYASDRQAREEILTRLNNVDGIFSAQLGMQLQVATMATRADVLPASTDASVLLKQLARLREQTPELNTHAITFLFTGRTLDEDRVGLAYTRSLCNPGFSAALARASANSGLDSLIAAHEIAHVLGAPHDGEKQCTNTPRQRFLMTPALVSSESIFSSCSIANMRPLIHAASCVVALDGSGLPRSRSLAAVPGTSAQGEESALLDYPVERAADKD